MIDCLTSPRTAYWIFSADTDRIFFTLNGYCFLGSTCDTDTNGLDAELKMMFAGPRSRFTLLSQEGADLVRFVLIPSTSNCRIRAEFKVLLVLSVFVEQTLKSVISREILQHKSRKSAVILKIM